MIDTGLMIPRCQPTWSNAHRGRDKIRVINHWIEDEDKYYSTRLADMEYPNISDGICPECSKELGI
jgi:hypothetical protein